MQNLLTIMDENEPLKSSLSGMRRKKLFRLLVLVTASSLVLPGLFFTLALQRETAQFLCNAFAENYAPQVSSVKASFNVLGDGPRGWNCYARLPNGAESPIAHLGIIPGKPSSRKLTSS